MKIGILLFSRPEFDIFAAADRLVEAGNALGHEVVKLYESRLWFMQGNVFYEGVELNVDAIIARPNFIEEPSLHTPTLLGLARAGIPVLNGHVHLDIAKNKLLQHFVLNEAGLPMPRWALVRETEEAQQAAQALGYPVIIKMAFGAMGKGVFFADRDEVFLPIVDYLSVRDGNPILLEEYISEADRSDLRIFVIKGRVIASMVRRARLGDVRSNAALGGIGERVEPTAEEADLAVRAAACIAADVAGVDILRSARGPLLMEINANPGFKELERVTGIDVARELVVAAVSLVDNG
jgi:ribosomal protein S6--L-glutamate ligase